MKSHPRRLAALASCALLLGACISGTAPDDGPTTLPPDDTASASPSPTASATSSPTASPSPTADPSSTADPFAVPEEITPVYVELVLNELYEMDAELVRDVLSRPLDEDAEVLPDHDLRMLNSLYADPLRQRLSLATLDLLRSADERDDLVPVDEYGRLQAMVEEVLETSPCLVARGVTDMTGVDAEPPTEPPLSFYFLAPAPDSNPTGWRFARQLDGTREGERVPDDEVRAVTAADLASQYPDVCE